MLGTGGHAHSVADCIEQGGKYHISGFLDLEEKKGLRYKEYEVIGTDDDLEKFFKTGIQNAFVTLGYMGKGTVREALYDKIKKSGYRLPNIIDPAAAVALDVKMGEGIFVGKQAVINAGTQIGDMCIINSAAVVEHDCMVGRYSHVAVGSVLCGGVHVGERTLIGAGAVVIQEVAVGENVLIGAGTVVTRAVPDGMIKYGRVERKRNRE